MVRQTPTSGGGGASYLTDPDGETVFAGDANGDGDSDPVPAMTGTGRIVVISGESLADENSSADYRLSFAGEITDTAETNSHDQISASEVNGSVYHGREVFQGTGEFDVEHAGGNPSNLKVHVFEENGEQAGTSTVSNGSTKTFSEDYSNGGAGGLGGLGGLLPNILPGIGPLSSGMTTALAILLGLAIVGTVISG